jgi:VIT1/CCC1 family predicted Fe2+/Mn2+ transporter
MKNYNIAILAILALAMGIAAYIAFLGSVDVAKEIVQTIVTGLIGALTGGAYVHRQNNTLDLTGAEVP